MYKYEKKINELGLEKQKLPKSIQSGISEIAEAENELKEVQNDFSNMDEDDEEREALKVSMDEYHDLIDDADEKLVIKIQQYSDKIPYYAEKAEHMKRARDSKKAATSPKPEVVPNKQAVQTTVAASPSISVSNTEVPIQVKKGKNTVGDWVFLGVLAVAGIFIGRSLVNKK
jgi:chromosome segregation ATPase